MELNLKKKKTVIVKEKLDYYAKFLAGLIFLQKNKVPFYIFLKRPINIYLIFCGEKISYRVGYW